MAVGKVESGVAMVDQPAMLMPNGIKVKIAGVRANDEDYAYAKPGENVELRLLGVEEEQLRKGCVLSSIADPVKAATVVEVQLIIVELLEHRPLLTCGYRCSKPDTVKSHSIDLFSPARPHTLRGVRNR